MKSTVMSVQQQCQNPEDLEEELEAGGKVPYVGTRIQRRAAKKKWVRFAADLSLEGEDFESVGTKAKQRKLYNMLYYYLTIYIIRS